MIRLDCTQCKTTLEMDEAFAGGVCRCQHCGTIQTVPAHLKFQQLAPSNADTVQTPAIPSPTSKSLYQSQPAPPPAAAPAGRTTAGLEELGNVVASSGLKSSRLREKEKQDDKQKSKAKPTRIASVPVGAPIAIDTVKVPDKGRPYVMLVAGGVVAIVAALLLWYFLRGGSRGNTDDAGIQGQAGVVAGGGAGFCGTPIGEPTVVYLLDRGSGSSGTFSYLKEATYKSIESLGSGRKFQIIFWDNGGLQTAYPTDAFTFATHENVEAARRALEDVFAFGDTNVRSSLEKAVARTPAAIVLATAKGWQLDDSFVTTVNEVRGGSPVKIYTFAISGSGDSTALKQIAEKTGGKYAEVSEAQLQAFTK